MKAYVKPDLVYENFELSDSIAVCAWDMNNNTDKSVCFAAGGVETDGTNLFVSGNVLCDFDLEVAKDLFEDYCYQPGTSDIKAVFNS